jgi:hypothetical protein
MWFFVYLLMLAILALFMWATTRGDWQLTEQQIAEKYKWEDDVSS